MAFPTIEVLAKTLGSDEYPISPSDLICDPVSMAKAFVSAYYKEQRNMADAVRHFIDPECVFSVLGNPLTIPFAGDFRGLDAFEVSVNRFFDLLEVPKGIDHLAGYRLIADQNDVILWGNSWIYPIGRPNNKPTPAAKLFRFREGNLCYYEDRIDSGVIESYLSLTVDHFRPELKSPARE